MENLIKWLEIVLKEKHDAETYAKGAIEEAIGDHFEIRSMHTKSGIALCFNFSDFGIEI
jgi:hypothetical protein